MILFYVLQNSGPRYKLTRHNAGAIVFREIIKSASIREVENLSEAEVFTIEYETLNGKIAFPNGFMNSAGHPAKLLLDYFKIPLSQLCVVHDDMDIPIGKTKLKFDGGSGGHKGLEFVIKQLNDNKFWKLRIGISKNEIKENRPQWLLENFSSQELEMLLDSSKTILKHFAYLLRGEFQKAQSYLNATAL